MRDSPIDLHNTVNLCKNIVPYHHEANAESKQVMVDLADGCTRPSQEEQQQNKPSSRTHGFGYESEPCPRKNDTDGLLGGAVLTAEAYAEARAREVVDIQELAASHYSYRARRRSHQW